MRTILLPFSVMLLAQFAVAQAVLQPEQVKLLEGKWQGDLVVYNPKNGQPRSLGSEMVFTGVGERRWRIGFGNATAPAANKMSSWALSDDGATCNKQAVVEVKEHGADSVRFVLQEDGMESTTPARIRTTYTVGKSTCTIRKEVLPIAEAEKADGSFAVRQEYRLRR